MMARLIATSLLLLLATQAQAQAQPQPPAPRTQPSRDVIVTYRVEGQAQNLIPGGIPGPLRLSWDAAGQRVRAEADGRSQVALLDLKNHTSQAIDTTLRLVLPLPLKASDLQPLTLEGARLTPRGRETIAGLPCTTYTVQATTPGSVCLTPDGVPLRGQGEISGKPGTFTATAVQYGRLSPDLFEVPRGYIALGGSSQSGLAGMAGKLGGMGVTPNDLRTLLGRGSK